MRNSPSSPNLRSCTFANWCSNESHQKIMKLQGQRDTMTISEATPNQCIALILMVVGHQNTGKRTLGHLRKKDIREPSTRGLASTVSEVAHQAEVVVVAEILSHISLSTACIMTVKPTTTLKTTPYSWSLKDGARL
jgi:hypothetical protein